MNGGAIFGASDVENITINSSTLSGNSFPAIVTDSPVSFANTIVANTIGGVNCRLDRQFNVTDLGGNLSTDATCPGINSDPKLGPLAHNGGPTQTMALLPGSPAIDAAACRLPVDQRGVARPQGLRCDIGAYELVADRLHRLLPADLQSARHQ